ncbi:MAG: bifunctional 5,10-methylene-tetrahydrofolate dehydrogenase/5,10-methylene-tetrahydrofolate cyclohydrolase [Alphaproteobacteria bacterium]|nr:bifunctional 5,10-methylene-tetrahydrofolate dehydrogenase/5,10-methylene-tetrahydrofolate cyclohydrolase [Alphaproteobacteria bacterium]
MAQIIDGLSIAEEFSEGIAYRVAEIKSRGVAPKLALISVGQNENAEFQISLRKKMAKQTGIDVVDYQFDDSVTSSELEKLIGGLNKDTKIHAILLQTPLSRKLSFRDIVNEINPEKDVDGLTTLNQGRLFLGEPGVIPCTSLGVLHLLRLVHDNISGLHAVVIGRSSAVGKPLAQLLLNANCTVTLLHSYSKDLESICKTADILISAVGKPRFVDESFIKKGATVIDVGITKVIDANGCAELVGDVNFDNVISIAGAITPVLKGVVPMTAAYLMHNTLKLACCY